MWRRSHQRFTREIRTVKNRAAGRRGSQVSATRPAARKTITCSPVNGVVQSAEAEARIAWVSQARCRQADPDELFVRGAAQRKAAVICRHCPVISECGADALDNR